MFGLTLIALLFVAALSAAPAFAEEAAAPQALPVMGAAAAVPVTCGLGLANLPTQTAKGETCAAQPESDVPEFLTNSKRLGYCHCGCVNQRVCRTSADCGGASCDQFISCC
jgi:hypothetical protein